MGNIWSTTQSIDDDEQSSSYEERDDEESTSSATEASEDDRALYSSLNFTHNGNKNSSNQQNTNHTLHPSSAKYQYTDKDKDKKHQEDKTPDPKITVTKPTNDITNSPAGITPVNRVNNVQLDNKQQQQQSQQPQLEQDQDDQHLQETNTRRWRSNSARGLKRVDLQNVNILVVDDDAVQRTVLRKWLHDEKYKNGILSLS